MASKKHKRTESVPIDTNTIKRTSHSKSISVISGDALNVASSKPVDLGALLKDATVQQNVEGVREDLLRKSVTFLKKKCKSLRISAQGNKTELIDKIIQKTFNFSDKKHIQPKLNRNNLNSKSDTIKKKRINKIGKKHSKKRKKKKKKKKSEVNTSETAVSTSTDPDTSWQCSKCTFINVLVTDICAMCGFEIKAAKTDEKNQNHWNTQKSETDIVILLVDGYINNIGQLTNQQIIPIEINAICFQYYYLTLKRWLQCNCCLPQYFGTFSINGFNDLSVVSLIESSDYLKNIGIVATMHQKQIWNEIVKLQQQVDGKYRIQFYYCTSFSKVERWLGSFGLRQYFDLFDKHYFDSPCMVADIESISELKKIGVKLKGHQVKIWNEIQKLKREKEMERQRVEKLKEMKRQRLEDIRRTELKEIEEYKDKVKIIQKQKEEKQLEKLNTEIKAWKRDFPSISKEYAYLYNDNVSVAKKEIFQRPKFNSYKHNVRPIYIRSGIQCWCERRKSAPRSYTFNISPSDVNLCNSCKSYQLPPYNDTI